MYAREGYEYDHVYDWTLLKKSQQGSSMPSSAPGAYNESKYYLGFECIASRKACVHM